MTATRHPIKANRGEWRPVALGDGRLAGQLAVPRQPRALLACIHGGGCTGRYFDLPGFSLASAAFARGYAVLLLDRPGHGHSPPIASERPILTGAALIARLIDQTAADVGVAPMLLGHSIGAAVALEIAADRPIPVAISGLGHRPTPAATAWLTAPKTASPLPPDFFFGPEGSFDWRAPRALRTATAAWRDDEVREVLCDWPVRAAERAARTRGPVQLRLAQYERIWHAASEDVAAFAALFVGTRVDAGILPNGGHLYDLHRRGEALHAAQLAFFDAAA